MSLSDLGILVPQRRIGDAEEGSSWESGTEEMPGTALWVRVEHWDTDRDWRSLPILPF